MVKALKFWGYCLVKSSRGSIEFANAWQGLWCTILFWVVGYERGSPVALPDKIDGYAVFFLLASLGLTWIGFFLFQFLKAPAELFWDERKKAEELRAASLDTHSELPDWTIRELFYHIDPEILDDADSNAYRKNLKEMKDAFSLNRLRVWGRQRDAQGLGEILGEDAPLVEIEPSYWRRSHFTLSFLDPSSDESAHTYVERGVELPEYVDLRVNRSKAMSVWPRDDAEKKFQLEIATNYPNVRIADNPSIYDHILQGGDRQKFLQLLSAGTLTGWARPMFGKRDFVRLTKEFWDLHFIEVMVNEGISIDSAGVERRHSQSWLKTKANKDNTHYDVCVNRAQMSKVWSDLSFTADHGKGE